MLRVKLLKYLTSVFRTQRCELLGKISVSVINSAKSMVMMHLSMVPDGNFFMKLWSSIILPVLEAIFFYCDYTTLFFGSVGALSRTYSLSFAKLHLNVILLRVCWSTRFSSKVQTLLFVFSWIYLSMSIRLTSKFILSSVGTWTIGSIFRRRRFVLTRVVQTQLVQLSYRLLYNIYPLRMAQDAEEFWLSLTPALIACALCVVNFIRSIFIKFLT